jgi:hypothetical protein
MPATTLGTIRATISGFCLIAIGLCFTRWAYTPLIPSMIDAGWVDKPEAGYLGAFNSVGFKYLDLFVVAEIALLLGLVLIGVSWIDQTHSSGVEAEA